MFAVNIPTFFGNLGISFLLSYYGIFSKLGVFQPVKNNKNIYTLTIRNDFTKLFVKHIKLTEEKKQNSLDNIIVSKKNMINDPEKKII